MSKKPTTTKSNRRATAAAHLAAAQRKERLVKLGTFGVVGVVLAGMGTAVWFGMSTQAGIDSAATPKNTTSAAGFVYQPVVDDHDDHDDQAVDEHNDTGKPADDDTGKPADADEAKPDTEPATTPADAEVPVVDVYADFQCPACGNFERQYGDQLHAMAAVGDIKLNYHMMSFLGQGSDLSAAAAGCAADQGKFADFHDELSLNPPAGQYRISDLIAAGANVGLTDSTFRKCVTDQHYKKFSDRVDTEAAKRGVTSTPTFFLDGNQIEATEQNPDPAQTLFDQLTDRIG